MSDQTLKDVYFCGEKEEHKQLIYNSTILNELRFVLQTWPYFTHFKFSNQKRIRMEISHFLDHSNTLFLYGFLCEP